MIIPDGFDSWREVYKSDIVSAEKELALKHFKYDPKAVIGDIYVLPDKKHQTFYAKLVRGLGFFKIIFVKPVQNSVWFSEPVFHYCICEAKRFEDHPTRRGRLVCHADFIDMQLVAELSRTVELLDDKQPDDAVSPTEEATLTAVRLSKNGITTRKVCFTDAAKLVFKDKSDNPEAVRFLRNFHLEVEKIIGIGE